MRWWWRTGFWRCELIVPPGGGLCIWRLWLARRLVSRRRQRTVLRSCCWWLTLLRNGRNCGLLRFQLAWWGWWCWRWRWYWVLCWRWWRWRCELLAPGGLCLWLVLWLVLWRVDRRPAGRLGGRWRVLWLVDRWRLEFNAHYLYVDVILGTTMPPSICGIG